LDVRKNETIINRYCVKNCTDFPGFTQILNRCVPKEETNSTSGNSTNKDVPTDDAPFMQIMAQDFYLTWHYILLCFVAAIVFAYIVLVLFRHAIKFIVWFVYVSIMVLIVAIAIGFWVMFAISKEPGAMIGAIIASVVGVIYICILLYIRDRIKLVIKIFKQASIALMDIPLILFEPILVSFHAVSRIIAIYYHLSIHRHSLRWPLPLSSSPTFRW